MAGLVEKVVVAVPARLQSSRLPNKVLADIGGQPMIQWVLERCREAKGVDATEVRARQLDIEHNLATQLRKRFGVCDLFKDMAVLKADSISENTFKILAFSNSIVKRTSRFILFHLIILSTLCFYWPNT